MVKMHLGQNVGYSDNNTAQSTPRDKTFQYAGRNLSLNSSKLLTELEIKLQM